MVVDRTEQKCIAHVDKFQKQHDLEKKKQTPLQNCRNQPFHCCESSLLKTKVDTIVKKWPAGTLIHESTPNRQATTIVSKQQALPQALDNKSSPDTRHIAEICKDQPHKEKLHQGTARSSGNARTEKGTHREAKKPVEGNIMNKYAIWRGCIPNKVKNEIRTGKKGKQQKSR